MRCAYTVIDVHAVRRTAYGDYLCTELVKHHRRNVVRRTVCTINHNTQPFEGQVIGKGAFAKLYVAACCVFQSPGFAQRGRINPSGWLFKSCLNRQLPSVVELGALRTKKLDAIVRKSVMASTDDHTQARTLGARQVSHAGGW